MSKKHRISYFDVVGKATGEVPEREVARAIEALSATYREGRDAFAHETAAGRAAYLWHILPAHVCDVARLLADLGVLEERRELRVVGLGSGPGTEVLALIEAASSARARGQLSELELVHATRIEQATGWDESFRALLPPLLEQVRARTPDYGDAWRLEAPAQVTADLTQPPLAAEAVDALAAADLVVAANLFTEVRPRGTDALPDGLAACMRQVLEAVSPPCELVVLDRAGAPGAVGRLAAFVQLAQEILGVGLTVVGPRERTSRCGCAFTRQGKAIYRHVRLPTTQDSDRPVKNCKTLWYHLVWEGP